MKKYLLFSWNISPGNEFSKCFTCKSPNGGWDDLNKSYDSLEEIKNDIEFEMDYDKYQIVDTTIEEEILFFDNEEFKKWKSEK